MKSLLWPEGAPFAQGNGTEDCPAITPYLIDSKEPAPAIAVFPGGGYGGRAHGEGEPIAQWLNTIGISAFVIDYRVAPYRHPCPLLDAQRAIRTIRSKAKEWNVDTNRVGALGFSAGGHLVSTLGTQYDAGDADAADPIERESCKPDVLVLCYPVITFGEKGHSGSKRNLLGEQPDEQLVKALSNENNVTGQTPKTFLWHTANDEAVPVENSLLFAQALSANNVPFALHVYPYGRHGMRLAEDDEQVRLWLKSCELWLRDEGF
ncbi:alpha/beta hydrolase [Paenibacillus sp. MBLB4367]|uniref:alpha/beta hydrolase n=1 Tax=Paenibacillus sp. MBLB4367 TaxID=3384767 RepID=UPI0039080F7E